MESQNQIKPLPPVLPGACDVCRRQAAVRYLDYDMWACAECARLYLAQLRLRG